MLRKSISNNRCKQASLCCIASVTAMRGPFKLAGMPMSASAKGEGANTEPLTNSAHHSKPFFTGRRQSRRWGEEEGKGAILDRKGWIKGVYKGGKHPYLKTLGLKKSWCSRGFPWCHLSNITELIHQNIKCHTWHYVVSCRGGKTERRQEWKMSSHKEVMLEFKTITTSW